MTIASGSATPSGPPPALVTSTWLGRGNGRLLYPISIALNVLLILLLYYCIWRILCGKAQQRRMNETTGDYALSSSSSSSSAADGSPSVSSHVARIRPDVLSTLPIYAYSMAGHGKAECAVCLAEFRDGDRGRLLPRCGHGFHADCIDVWILSHSSCPLCRAAVEEGKALGSDEVV